jgi:hypothetical protein
MHWYFKVGFPACWTVVSAKCSKQTERLGIRAETNETSSEFGAQELSVWFCISLFVEEEAFSLPRRELSVPVLLLDIMLIINLQVSNARYKILDVFQITPQTRVFGLSFGLLIRNRDWATLGQRRPYADRAKFAATKDRKNRFGLRSVYGLRSLNRTQLVSL